METGESLEILTGFERDLLGVGRQAVEARLSSLLEANSERVAVLAEHAQAIQELADFNQQVLTMLGEIKQRLDAGKETEELKRQVLLKLRDRL